MTRRCVAAALSVLVYGAAYAAGAFSRYRDPDAWHAPTFGEFMAEIDRAQANLPRLPDRAVGLDA